MQFARPDLMTDVAAKTLFIGGSLPDKSSLKASLKPRPILMVNSTNNVMKTNSENVIIVE
jgi:hypothetical protein